MNSRMVVRSIAKYRINIIVKILIISDFIIFSAAMLLSPILAIFIEDFIVGATLKTVGIASALFLITKSLVEMPIGMLIDKIKGEKDDLFLSVFGILLTGVLYILFIYIDQVWQLYAIQILLGMAAAISYPGWCTIFTRHLDKGKEGTEWSLYDVLTGIGMAGTAALGGLLAESFGFNVLFITVAAITFLGGLLLILISGRILKA